MHCKNTNILEIRIFLRRAALAHVLNMDTQASRR
jgi:hypothetical protein